MKYAPVLLAVFAISTFVLTLLINKALGTTDTQFLKSFSIWIFLQLPGLLLYITAADKIKQLESQIN